jgi:Tfp pilus assembly protein PilN
MIKINLKVGQKRAIPVVLGVPVNVINAPAIIIVLIFVFFSNSIAEEWLAGKNENITNKLRKINKINGKLKKRVRKEGNIQKKIEELETEKQKFKKRFDVVKEIIKRKKNPMNIMLYISKNIPEDVWLKELIVEDDTITISGETNSYPSISTLIASLERATFFDKNIELLKAGTLTDKDGRKDTFSLKAKIRKYD